MAFLHFSQKDRFIIQIQNMLDMACGVQQEASRASPATIHPEADLSVAEKQQTASLMRINHCGEVCAQALYQGQALACNKPDLYQHFLQSANEEQDHLLWCKWRIDELGSNTSILNGYFYMQSFLIGVGVAFVGDAFSLGFITETEKQVFKHLQGHIDLTAPKDKKTLAVLNQMQIDEKRHGDLAHELGGVDLPPTVRYLMNKVYKIMTLTTYRI